MTTAYKWGPTTSKIISHFWIWSYILYLIYLFIILL